MKSILGIFTALLLAPLAALHAVDTKPNIIFILADDLGYGYLGSYDCPDIRTPPLDAFAAQIACVTEFWRRVPEPVRTRVVLQRALRSSEWKYIKELDSPTRLFDLGTDHAEGNHLTARHPDLCDRFRRPLDKWEATKPASNPSYASFTKKPSNP